MDNLVYGVVESLAVHFRRSVVSADLANELQGGVVKFRISRVMMSGKAQSLDISTHGILGWIW